MSQVNKPVEFLQQIGLTKVISMFDLMPDIIFWIKDQQGRFVYANQAFIEHFGQRNLSQIVGKNDYDFAPDYLAKQYVIDDEKVQQGQEINERLEMNMTSSGELAWYSTSKRPLFSEDNEFIGSYGITRHLQKMSKALSGIEAVKLPVEYVRKNYRQVISVEQLAEISHLSVSALERRFKKYLAKTPKQFINEVRLENARRLLVETQMPISQVGYETGFADHSYFSKQFRLFFGELPSDFREAYTQKQ
ncbi:AraC family transcriptional regulator [Saccharobesus litoralis]|uniref:AraC family transcriptional regulator n=1 Tax=Saccharobesus litoralis TaxID=2172099 RepID=A0A2S0VMI9_9ALTE|nr:helix-turn-helix domain-containing protein [Saccharobesus litoralis]AWB65433.1 AraC family transcriptional regulator [Saccharobesus litoralis]